MKESYRELFAKYKRLNKELAILTENEQQIAHKIDLYTFQVEEIHGRKFSSWRRRTAPRREEVSFKITIKCLIK